MPIYHHIGGEALSGLVRRSRAADDRDDQDGFLRIPVLSSLSTKNCFAFFLLRVVFFVLDYVAAGEHLIYIVNAITRRLREL
jgi:hypothetical protein